MMKVLKRIIAAFVCVCVLVSGYALTVNFYMIFHEKSKMITEEEAVQMKDVDAVLVLGCGIREDNTPSVMLNERLKCGTEIVKKSGGKLPLLLSGDNSGKEYNEVAVMKNVSVQMEVPEEKILTDDFGFSTYESIYNAVNTFLCKKIVIVTQSYHMPRALYIAEKLGLEAYGVNAYLPHYPRQIIWSLREVLARNKDFIKCNIKNFKGGELR
ncbi:MAG: vancomycin high temperature exclusion protein [Acutalibacteraceae bacterium]